MLGIVSFIDGKFGDALALVGDGLVRLHIADSLHRDLFKSGPFTLGLSGNRYSKLCLGVNVARIR